MKPSKNVLSASCHVGVPLKGTVMTSIMPGKCGVERIEETPVGLRVHFGEDPIMKEQLSTLVVPFTNVLYYKLPRGE